MICRLLPLALFGLVAVAQADNEAKSLPRKITLSEARDIALQKHPKISIADLRTLAAKQVVSQAVAQLFPQITVTAGGAKAGEDDARIVTSALPVSSVLERAGGAVLVSQLITDFGRTWHLRNSSKLKAGAEEFNAQATRAQILLQVDGAYYGALQAQALLLVADSTVQTRRFLRDQISTLAKNQLKSELDASFAEINYQDAVLLRSKASNDVQSAFATLAALLDEPQTTNYRLAPPPSSGSLAKDVSGLIAQAMQNRPDLQRFRLESKSAREFARAETALSFPTVSVQGTAGLLPWHDDALNDSYAAAGFVVSWPFFTGGYNTARRKEADFRAKAADAIVHDEENSAIRDVRLAWLAATNAQERIDITEKLFDQATRTLALARARYDAGGSSIVELSQSQLNLTSTEITHTNARYEYFVRRSLLDYQIGALR
jgi:outer membrane protein